VTPITFNELDDLLEDISTHVAHLKNPSQYQTHLDELHNISEILAANTTKFERYKEKNIIESDIILKVSDNLMRYFAKNPRALYSIDPRL
jgi:hypothetical protein